MKRKIIGIFILVFVILFTSMVSVYAIKAIESSNVSYDNSESGLPNTVQGALDELYNTCNQSFQLTKKFNFTGNYQTFTAQYAGTYKVELWGAQGGSGQGFNYKIGGYGGYTSGNLKLGKGDKLYVYVGSKGTDAPEGTYGETHSNIAGGYNGGGKSTGNGQCWGSGGGGATDIRTVSGLWDNSDSLNSRIMVAGAGGGSSIEKNRSAFWEGNGGAGGGLEGYPGNTAGNTQCLATTGGSQSSGGTSQCRSAGIFGSGSSGNDGGGGGSGYYGGAGTACSGGSGGSSYINGHDGCATTNNSYVFTNTKVIDGEGYSWTNVKGSLEQMPKPSGGFYESEKGNSGDGYARITLIALDDF